MRWALAQLDPTIGDLAGNAAAIRAAARRAEAEGASLLAVPELMLLGYPPRDLLLRDGVAENCLACAESIAAEFPRLAILIGLPRRVPGDPRPFRNAIALCRNGRIERFADKRLLPTYDVFDEDRYFTPGSEAFCFEHEGVRVGVAICEDLWRALDARGARGYASDPVEALRRLGCRVILSPGASPFVRGKYATRLGLLSRIAAESQAAVVQLNLVGAADDLVFDGGSAALDARGRFIGIMPRFQEAFAVVDPLADGSLQPPGDDVDAETAEALVAGIAGYMRKTGHERAILGLSGGIDSAVAATLAVMALGPDRVSGLLLPSRFSSEGSIRDALDLADRLGMAPPRRLAIEPVHAAAAEVASGAGGLEVRGLVDENLQSRVRGLLLMAASNAEGSLLLTTGNKSELATGYCTLYGDMNGGLAPLGDLLKTEVYALADSINRGHRRWGFARPPVPEASIAKAPSAELRPDQSDADSLPPYDRLDAIVRAIVEEERSDADAAAAIGISVEEVARWRMAIDRAEFKRHQAPPILKCKARSFGRGRPMPLAARWNPAWDASS
jgi:NAD+ synthase (glutamine-hydrolysing)